MKLLGVDIGGTFTDLILTDTETGEIYTHKVPSTVVNPSIGMVNGIKEICQKAGIELKDVQYLVHGTTVGTNALLTHDGAKTGMITTKGYRDIIRIGRHQRPMHYSILQEIPWQDRELIKRRYRKVVSERIGPDGEVIQGLDEQEARRVITELRDAGVESIAVCFLFSYRNATHEEIVQNLIEEIYPEAFITTSSSIFPQFREFERFTTTAINAFVGPKVKKYIRHIVRSLEDEGLKGDLHIMRSNGGIATAQHTGERPVTTLLSGPAAGILGGEWVGKLSERSKLITFDVGGTSADIGIVTTRGILEASARDTWLAGFPVMVPILDVHSIGAGGGSIAYVDDGGAFRVGPLSAGADPGPACYGMGGIKPTVTDANLVLGRLDKDHFLGGDMIIYPDLSNQVIQKLGDHLHLDCYEAAAGVIDIVNSNMANAIRSKTIQKGYDPREFSLVAFGGAGPMQAAEVAEILDIQEVVVPFFPGITSAMGLLTTDLKYDEIKNVFMLDNDINLEKLNADLEMLEIKVKKQLSADGLPDSKIIIQRGVDCRYVGQGYELRVELPQTNLTDNNIPEVWERFHKNHEEEYGHRFQINAIEIVNLRVIGFGQMPKIENITNGKDRKSSSNAFIGTTRTRFRYDGKLQEFETRCYARSALDISKQILGPAVIYQRDSTTVVPPLWNAKLHSCGTIILYRK